MSDSTASVHSSTATAMTSSTMSSTTSSVLDSTSAAGSSTLAGAAQSVNITSLINIRLDMTSTAYRRWRRLFNVVLGRFNLLPHVDGTPARPNDPLWIQEDLTVLMWLHATLADDLFDMVSDDNLSAHGVWTRIADFFLGNRDSRAVQLEQDLHNLEQGDMSAAAYCHRLKTLADALADCGRQVGDRPLVHQLIRGLNPKYHVLKQMLPQMPTFPTFIQARDQLIVAENTLATSKTDSTDTALVATNGSSSSGTGSNNNSQRPEVDRAPADSSSRGRGRGGGRGGRGRGRGGGRNNSNNSRASQGSNAAVNPAVLMQQLAGWLASGSNWRAPWTGATGPGTNYRAPVGQAYNAATQMAPAAPPSFDTTALLQALQAATLPQQNAQSEWFMDTGASGHMTGDSGSSQQDRDHETQFRYPIQSLQCDNGTEFVNSDLRHFLTKRGVTYRLSCPYTSAQNGKAERALRTTNDVLRTLLFQANLSPKYWVEALHTATYLINRRPSKPIQLRTPTA
ncbi:hypothetical protein U9M48_001277 [Paspalum notatum var. saurae]|uniref:Integrase catalytic domain-containing protein n=1 Tax=Paspalum notatum var. saurae TaxID=547442 RepID=A0AAQ3PN76_PASNO